MTGPLWQASAIEVAAGIREKQFSCSEVMTAVVERIRALNPKLNAIILDLTDQALAEAAAADRALKDLAAPGPLFGVPVTIKVNIDVEGQATPNGVPAFANGVTTLKPTPGRIPAFNPSAAVERGFLAQLTSVQGAIARTVQDVRLATRVMAAGDPSDPLWVPVPFDGEPLEKPIRVAVTRNSHGYPIHPGISRLIDRTAAYLSDAGYEVVETEPPSIMEPARGWFTVLLTELKGTLGPTVEQFGTNEVRQIFAWYYELGTILDLDGYRLGLADRTRMMRAWNVFFDAYPLVLTPFLMRPTYPWNYDAQGRMQTKDLFDASIYSYGVNYRGLPAGVVPIDLVEDLPAGVQLVARRFREDVIFDAMAAIEQRAGRLVNRLWARG